VYSLRDKRVWVAGHRGMVGRAISRKLSEAGSNVIEVDRTSLDLRDQSAVRSWMDANRPDAIFVAAARVGGILANSRAPADFLYDNLIIEANIIEAAFRNSVEKLCFLGSSCIYPKYASQPLREESLLTGPLEPTNEWYAIAKIAGIKLVEAYRIQHGCNYISAMPTNLYGPHDNFDLASSHVLPALIRKVHEAKVNASLEIEVWGTGEPMREFLHVDDCADACIFLMEQYSDIGHVNIGCGEDIKILNLVQLICEVVGFDGNIILDRSKPDGTPRKLMSIDKIRSLGWSPTIDLSQGIRQTYKWFLQNVAS
jgi:GDP-L-fucose synthase